MSAFGRLLKELIAERGLTQAEFGRRVGLSQAAISQIVNGKHPPSPERAELWVEALELRGPAVEEFLLQFDLANSPPRIQRLVSRLMRRAN